MLPNLIVIGADWGRGLDWYESQFDASARVLGESSPGYSALLAFAGWSL